MSINLAIKVPLEAVAALEDGSLQALTTLGQVVADSIAALPYKVTVARTSAAAVSGGRGTTIGGTGYKASGKNISFKVITDMGEVVELCMDSNARWSHVAAEIHKLEGISPQHQCLVFGYNREWDGKRSGQRGWRTLAEVRR